MRRLWLFCLPLVFLPNLGNSVDTGSGVLGVSDFVIGPYLLLVYLAREKHWRTLSDELIPPVLAFLAWALMLALLIGPRYDYPDSYYTWFSLYKLGKFTAYALAGYLTTQAIKDPGSRRRFYWSLAAAGLVTGLGLIFLGQKSASIDVRLTAEGAIRGYKASNEMSVVAAMISCFLSGIWLQRKMLDPYLRTLVPAVLLALVLGSGISEGRGGWIGGIAGLTYLVWRTQANRKAASLLLTAAAVIVVCYFAVPVFQARVDQTLNPGADAAGVAGIDDGSRPIIWAESIRNFPSAFGTGFFHRGGRSGVYVNGSHNFFLEMFLETGLPGGILMLFIWRILWRHAGMPVSKAMGVELPVKATILAAGVGGMGGEYFYGGVALFTLLILYGAAGCLPRAVIEQVIPDTTGPNMIEDETFAEEISPGHLA